jgi:hypothetical protein
MLIRLSLAASALAPAGLVPAQGGVRLDHIVGRQDRARRRRDEPQDQHAVAETDRGSVTPR